MTLRLLLVATLAAGCGVGDGLLPADFAACPAEAPVDPPAGALTYYEHVKPILDARCAGCHVEGGLAPFALTSADLAYEHHTSIADAVAARRMPPWQPNDCCRDYLWKRSLPALERETIVAWARQGGPTGLPEDEGPPLPRDDAALERVDVSLTMPAPYTPVPKIGADDVRCFLLDWPVDREVYARGLDVRPGNRPLVHHVIVFTVDADEADDLAALDAEDDAPGWDCTGFGVGFQPTGSIGGWTPGDRATTLPGGLGHKVPAGSRLVLNIHYDTGHGAGEDQTSIDVMIEDEVEREAEGVGVGNPQWLVDGGMHIPANDPDAMFWFAYDATTVVNKGKPFQIWGVNLHMHELGSRASLAVLRADGTTECLLDIPAWDFGWLSDYWLTEPVTIYPGDRVYVECHFDNTGRNQKIVNGELQEPRDLGWGTDEEMCGGILKTADLVGGDS